MTPEMRIAREEIFGPVLSIMPYDSDEQAIENRQRHASMASRPISRPRTSKGRAQVAPADARRQRSISTIPSGTRGCRSAATSSPAMAANTPNTASTTSWKSRDRRLRGGLRPPVYSSPRLFAGRGRVRGPGDWPRLCDQAKTLKDSYEF